jgi:hypothetical protein
LIEFRSPARLLTRWEHTKTALLIRCLRPASEICFGKRRAEICFGKRREVSRFQYAFLDAKTSLTYEIGLKTLKPITSISLAESSKNWR